MNNSKENILKRIAAAGMPEYAYPDFGYEPQHFDDPAAMFAQRLRAAGGEAVWLDGATTLDEVVRRCYPDAKSVASALPEVTLATVNPDRVEDPRELVDIDLGVVSGAFGVAENGAVWIPQDIRHKALYFGATALMVVIPRDEVQQIIALAKGKLEMETKRLAAIREGDLRPHWLDDALRKAGMLADGETL